MQAILKAASVAPGPCTALKLCGSDKNLLESRIPFLSTSFKFMRQANYDMMQSITNILSIWFDFAANMAQVFMLALLSQTLDPKVCTSDCLSIEVFQPWLASSCSFSSDFELFIWGSIRGLDIVKLYKILTKRWELKWKIISNRAKKRIFLTMLQLSSSPANFIFSSKLLIH